MTEFLSSILTKIGEFITSFGFKLIGAILVLVIGLLLIKWVGKIISKGKRFQKLSKNAQILINNIIKGALYVILFVTIALIVGVPAASLIAVIGSCGLAIGLALQGGLSNIAGGIIILCTKPFEVGDFIDNGAYLGTVTDIGLFYTTLKTPDNKKVIVPNGTISNQSITDYSQYETRRLDVKLSVSRDCDIDLVKDTLISLANAHDLVLKDPAPQAMITEYSESGPIYTLRVWVKSDDYWTVNFDFHEYAKKVFDKRGIEMPYPQVEIHQK